MQIGPHNVTKYLTATLPIKKSAFARSYHTITGMTSTSKIIGMTVVSPTRQCGNCRLMVSVNGDGCNVG